MSFEYPGADALDYLPCRYGASRLMFRGPRRPLDGPYIACLGGTETYGRCVAEPFPALLEAEQGVTAVNFGLPNAGLDVFLGDAEIQRLAAGASLRVVQVLGAANLSNRFYRVHPRRNDRFVTASPILAKIYRDVDFTEFTFVRHLLNSLRTISPERFDTVREELRSAWLGRMRLLLKAIGGPTLLLWLRVSADAELGDEPVLVTQAMIDALRDQVAGVVTLDLQPAGLSADIGGMVVGQMETALAAHLIGPAAHEEIAAALIRSMEAIG